jgi:hypothetical protein
MHRFRSERRNGSEGRAGKKRLTFRSLDFVHAASLADHTPAHSVAGISSGLILLHADKGVVVGLSWTVLHTNSGSGGEIISIGLTLYSRVVATDPTIVVDLIGQSGVEKSEWRQGKAGAPHGVSFI